MNQITNAQSRFKIVALTALLGLFCLSAGQLAPAQDFRSDITPLIQASCIECHDGSEDNGLDFSKLGSDLSDEAIFRTWERVYDRVTNGEMPPASSDRPPKLDTDSALRSIKKALTDENLKFQHQNGRVILRRLTRTEYAHTLNDLLHVQADLGDIIPEENSSSGFDTVSHGQGLSPLHIRSYLEAAEVALEAAIRLDPKPDSKTRHFDYLESKLVRKHLDEENDHIIVGELDDAIVMFSNASYIYKIDHHVEAAGKYILRAKARPFQAKKPVILTLNAGNYNRGFTEVLGFFDLQSEKTRTVEVETYLTKGQYMFPGLADVDVQPDGKTIWNIGPKEYKGSGIAIQWMELEGPIVESWPPFSTTNLLKDIELKELEDKKWDPSRQQHIQYEIVAGKDPRKQLEAIVAWLAPRAFRRPLYESEGTPFVEIGLDALSKGRTFDASIRKMCRTILASPQFLFMAPEQTELNHFDIASRLSYFLWKSIPDHKLFMLANKEQLRDPKIIKEQVDRLLADEKSSRFIKDFIRQWLQLSEIDATAPDKRLYPEFDDLLKMSMVGETEQFISHLIKNDLSITNLVDSNFAFLNRRLAEHYGIEGVEGQYFRKVKLKNNTPRGGILTNASVLKVTANGTTTSPVKRGSWVLTHLLGQPPSPPPPTIGAIEPDTRGTTTIREMLDKHRNDDSCSSCHRLIDPPGFALECFDVIGGFRDRFRSQGEGDSPKTKLNGRNIWEYKLGLHVDASGELTDGQKFDGIEQYKKLLLKEREQIARNFIEQLIVYSTGAEIQFADRSEVERILRVCSKKDFGMKTMIYEIVQSKLFLQK